MIVFPWMYYSTDMLTHGIEIRQLDGKFDIVRSDTGEIVLPYKYDNIFNGHDVFLLRQGGKWGAVRYEGGVLDQIVPCEYDDVDNEGPDWIFSNADELRYYFSSTHTVRTFQEVFVYTSGKHRYLLARDDEFNYIIDCNTDTELWTYPYNDGCCPPNILTCAYLGEKNGFPLFFDLVSNVYILPHGNNGLVRTPTFPDLIMPITVNGRNIINILGGKAGLQVSELGEDLPEDISRSIGFDEVTVEVKVTLKGRDHIEERCYPIPGGTLFAGDQPDFYCWH